MKGIKKQTRHEKTRNLREIAHQGDAILYDLTLELLQMENFTQKLIEQKVPQFVSNVVIAHFEIGFDWRKDKYVSLHMRGDMTEAWIWFLYVNYGKLTTLRYLRKQLRFVYRGKYFKEPCKSFWTPQRMLMMSPNVAYYEIALNKLFYKQAA